MSEPTPKSRTDKSEGLDTDSAVQDDQSIAPQTEDAPAPESKLDEDETQSSTDPATDEEPEQTDEAQGTEKDPDDASEELAALDRPADDAEEDTDAKTVGDSAESGEQDDPEPVKEPAPTQTVVEKRGGFFAPFLGGVVAAGVGFGLCYYLVDQGILNLGDQETFETERAQISALEEQFAALQSEVSGLGEDPRVPAISEGVESLQSALGDVQAEIGSLQGEIEAQTGLIDSIRAELDAIAEMPVATGGADTAAVAALQTRLQEQQSANAEMQSQLQQMAEEARAEMEEVRNRASALQAETQAAVDEATNRAALANLTSALENGTPLAQSIGAITVEVPEALSSVAESGVSTVLELQRAFPAAARAGLAESLKVTVGDAPTDRFMAFLQAQVGARSLEAREGDDPDAILARAQEAVSAARFEDALAEISALPPEGQSAMSGWTSDASARVEALAARDALAAELTSN